MSKLGSTFGPLIEPNLAFVAEPRHDYQQQQQRLVAESYLSAQPYS